nr:sialidase-3 isoform X2 [Marmota flaviventris]
MEEVTSSSFNNPLFQQEDKKGITYRIPALLYVPPTCTFLAFAERRSTSRDVDALYLVLRRGLRTGHSVQWGPLKPLVEASLPGHRTMNPCPVWEQKSGCVYLFFICVRNHVTERQQIMSGKNAARLCFVCSQDAGCSWSEVIQQRRGRSGMMLTSQVDMRRVVLPKSLEHGGHLAAGKKLKVMVPGAVGLTVCSNQGHPFLFYPREMHFFFSLEAQIYWNHIPVSPTFRAAAFSKSRVILNIDFVVIN